MIHNARNEVRNEEGCGASILIAMVLLALGVTAEARLPILRLNSGSSSCKEDDPIAARVDRPIWVLRVSVQGGS